MRGHKYGLLKARSPSSFLRQSLMCPRRPSNSLCKWGWLWTSDPPPSISQVLELQAWTSTPSLSNARNRTQGFVQVKQQVCRCYHAYQADGLLSRHCLSLQQASQDTMTTYDTTPSYFFLCFSPCLLHTAKVHCRNCPFLVFPGLGCSPEIWHLNV